MHNSRCCDAGLQIDWQLQIWTIPLLRQIVLGLLTFRALCIITAQLLEIALILFYINLFSTNLWNTVFRNAGDEYYRNKKPFKTYRPEHQFLTFVSQLQVVQYPHCPVRYALAAAPWVSYWTGQAAGRFTKGKSGEVNTPGDERENGNGPATGCLGEVARWARRKPVVGVVINVCGCHDMRAKWVDDLNILSRKKQVCLFWRQWGFAFQSIISLFRKCSFHVSQV
jgi:hypothetical protein